MGKRTTSLFVCVRLQRRAVKSMLGEKARAMARVVIADGADLVTQRGNGRQFILASEGEHGVYLAEKGCPFLPPPVGYLSWMT